MNRYILGIHTYIYIYIYVHASGSTSVYGGAPKGAPARGWTANGPRCGICSVFDSGPSTSFVNVLPGSSPGNAERKRCIYIYIYMYIYIYIYIPRVDGERAQV